MMFWPFWRTNVYALYQNWQARAKVREGSHEEGMSMIFIVVGARPNFPKIAPILHALKARNCSVQLVHTGQHYDYELSDSFFADLHLPKPDFNLNIGSGTHAEQTGRCMIAFEQLLFKHHPRLVIVAGDVNSTLACTLAAAKCGIPVAHVEAGLRSFDRTMPEEINRILVDSIADIHFTTCPDANKNLYREGHTKQVYWVGNTMIDSLIRARWRCPPVHWSRSGHILVTAHRPSNVDTPEAAGTLIEMIRLLKDQRPVWFPVHPRTEKMLKRHGLYDDLVADIVVTAPLTYSEFIYAMDNAGLVVTDSGGVQEETTALNVPCITIRDNTERPVTVREGTNHLTGCHPRFVAEVASRLLAAGHPNKKPIPLWDGHAADRISDVLRERGYE